MALHFTEKEAVAATAGWPGFLVVGVYAPVNGTAEQRRFWPYLLERMAAWSAPWRLLALGRHFDTDHGTLPAGHAVTTYELAAGSPPDAALRCLVCGPADEPRDDPLPLLLLGDLNINTGSFVRACGWC